MIFVDPYFDESIGDLRNLLGAKSSEELKKLKSLYKKGLLKFGSKEIAEAMLEDLGTGITGKKIKGKD